jgi:Tat protein secretion system quality control protein TatD with DNase activity
VNEVQRRHEQVIAWRAEGWTFGKIAGELGLSVARAQSLHKAALIGRDKQQASAARAAASGDTVVTAAGLHPDLARALSEEGLRTLAAVMRMDRMELARAVLCYPNVGRRVLEPLFELCDRLERDEEAAVNHIAEVSRIIEASGS